MTNRSAGARSPSRAPAGHGVGLASAVEDDEADDTAGGVAGAVGDDRSNLGVIWKRT